MTLFTQFPSISQFRTKITDINHEYNESTLPVVKFHGTVKLHGTNAALGLLKDNTFWVQSRNNVITPEKDNAGFATFIKSHEENVKTLLEKIRGKFNYKAEKICVFGEWCGGNIQKGVALGNLPKMFVIFAIIVDEIWISHENFKPFHSHNDCIYNIEEFPTWDIEIDFNSPQLMQNTLKELTETVEKCCPVGKHFGVEGIGEGIVWTGNTNLNRVIFKVKGNEHSVTRVKTLASVDVEKIESIKEFVEYAATDNRFDQAMNVLFISKNKEPTVKDLGDFLKWIVTDIIKEETDTLELNGLSVKDVSSVINVKAKKWFFAKYINP
jgi:hypothetical protein